MWSLDENNNDLVWSQPELGVASSALKGTANLQNVNTATDPGAVMAAFARTAQQSAAISSGTLTPDGATLFDGPAALRAGMWIKVTASTVSSIDTVVEPTSVTLNYLAVGGGGGGGHADSPGSNLEAVAGGGGGGEVLESTASFSVGTYAVTVGNGGSGGTGTTDQGDNGEDTVIAGIITANGGGGGGGADDSTVSDGEDGGNGGGAANLNGVGASTPGTGDQFDGGASNGGGGGAGEVGAAGNGSTSGGNGGDGLSSSITGTSTFYGGGGGGGAAKGVSPNAGNGGAGGGADGGAEAVGANGTANTGGGGGGAGAEESQIFDGGNGGSGIAVISYTTGTIIADGGTVTHDGNTTIHTFTSDDTFQVIWIKPTAGYYFVSYEDDSDQFKLSDVFDPYGASAVTHGTTGSITFDTVAAPVNAIDKATEKYQTATGTEYRYYALDSAGFTWVYDTQVYDDTLANNNVGLTWALTDPYDYGTDLTPKGMDVLNGWLMLITYRRILCKPTVTLGAIVSLLEGGWLTNPFDNHPNYAYTGSQGTLLYTDGNFIGEIFPTTSLITSVANLQSYAEYTASTTTGTIATLIGGSIPSHVDGTRLPVVLFTSEGGTLPTAITTNTVYYIEYNFLLGTFGVYSNLTGGSALDIATGAVGTQYFNSFYPVGNDAGAGGTNPTLQFTPQRMNLPFYEVAQKMVEIDNTILVGCKGNIVYPWNQVDAVPSGVITLPESDVQTMLNVNNTAYVFAGDKANIYLVNTTASSLVLTIPDYTAGVPGTPNSYIEPTFAWGDAIFCRGRVYCSVLDQTATKAGNCGGMWSFIPSENVDPQQDVGSSLRLENQSSYGDYDGYSNILIVDQEQEGKSPKYWNFWQDSYDTASANFGIDYSTENPVTEFIIETDLLQSGTNLDRTTFEQVEYKLTTPPAAGDDVALHYRLSPKAAWSPLTNKMEQTDTVLSGVYQVNFEKTEWLQVRAVGTTSGDASTSTFVPLREIRLR